MFYFINTVLCKLFMVKIFCFATVLNVCSDYSMFLYIYLNNFISFSQENYQFMLWLGVRSRFCKDSKMAKRNSILIPIMDSCTFLIFRQKLKKLQFLKIIQNENQKAEGFFVKFFLSKFKFYKFSFSNSIMYW